MNVSINLLAVLATGIFAMIIGSIWYSPMLFGDVWMKLINMTREDMEKAKQRGMAKFYLIAFIAALLMNYVLAHFIKYTNAVTFIEGMICGFWIWFGFVATISINGILWENKPFTLYLINVCEYFVVLLLSGGILAIWI